MVLGLLYGRWHRTWSAVVAVGALTVCQGIEAGEPHRGESRVKLVTKEALLELQGQIP